MSRKDTYDKILESIINSVSYIRKVDNEEEMADAYVDTYMTEQQRTRDKKITQLLEAYVIAYEEKSKSNKWYKRILFICNCFILMAFAIIFLKFICKIDFSGNPIAVTSLVEIVSVCITFLALIVGVLKIITKYVFPEKEDEYITRIVEIIQNNDLENKKENIRAQVEKVKSTEDTGVNIEIIDEL